MRQNRRQFLAGAAALAASGMNRPRARQKKGTRLILLGTKGGPSLAKFRKNPATLLLIKGTPFLVDCGYGAARQLMDAGVEIGRAHV